MTPLRAAHLLCLTTLAILALILYADAIDIHGEMTDALCCLR